MNAHGKPWAFFFEFKKHAVTDHGNRPNARVGQNRRMPNLANLLKGEFTRLARKQIKAESAAIKKSLATYRAEISALKKRLALLERQSGRLAKRGPTEERDVQEESGQPRLRFRAQGFAKLRQRLGLSAAACGALLGVSPLSVYKWESGKARPRARHLPAIAALRTMKKRDLAERLAGLPQKQ